jgi:hypothetical protein
VRSRRAQAITATTTPTAAGKAAISPWNTTTWVMVAPIIRPTNAMLATPQSTGMSRATAPATSRAPMRYRNQSPKPIASKPATACGLLVSLGIAANT